MDENNMINKEEYTIAYVEKKILKIKKMEDTPTNRRFVRRICDDISIFFDIDLANDFSGKDGYNRAISIVSKLYDDGKTKGILKKIINNKNITEEEKEQFKSVMRKTIRQEESKEYEDKLEREYEFKKEISEEIKNVRKEMKENFCNLYDKYIDLLLEGEWITEELKGKICNVNDEIMNVLNKKVNDIMYNKELLNLMSEEDTMDKYDFLVKLQNIQKLYK